MHIPIFSSHSPNIFNAENLSNFHCLVNIDIKVLFREIQN